MQFVQKLGVFIWVGAIFVGWGAPIADAREFLDIGVSVELRHSSLDQKSRRMGKIRGQLRVRDDLEQALLTLGSNQFPVQMKSLYVGRESRRVSGRLELTGDQVYQVLSQCNRSVWRGRQRRAQVRQLLERYQANESLREIYSLPFRSLPQLDFDQADLTRVSLEFSDDESSDGLILTFDFDDRV